MSTKPGGGLRIPKAKKTLPKNKEWLKQKKKKKSELSREELFQLSLTEFQKSELAKHRYKFSELKKRDIVWLPSSMILLYPHTRDPMNAPEKVNEVLNFWRVNVRSKSSLAFEPSERIETYFLAKLRGLAYYRDIYGEIFLATPREYNFGFLVGSKLKILSYYLQNSLHFAICEIQGLTHLPEKTIFELGFEPLWVRSDRGLMIYGYTTRQLETDVSFQTASGFTATFPKHGTSVPAPFSIVRDTLFYPCHYDPRHKLMEFTNEAVGIIRGI